MFFCTWEKLVCVTEQDYISMFFTRLWAVRKPLLFVQLHMCINTKPNGMKNEAKTQRKFFVD